jgi:hypothetical protein
MPSPPAEVQQRIVAQLGEHLGELLVRVELEHLRPDVRVQPGELELVDPVDRLAHRLDPEAELRVLLPGGYVGVRVRLDPGRHAQHHALPGGHLLEPVELVERVDHDAADARLERVLELGDGLVVAVEVDPLGGEAAAQREEQLAARRDVARQPLLGEQPVGGRAGERLARVNDLEALAPAAERVDELPGPRADVVLRVHVRGGAELLRHIGDVAAADLEVPPLVDARPARIHVRDPGGRGAFRGSCHSRGGL